MGRGRVEGLYYGDHSGRGGHIHFNYETGQPPEKKITNTKGRFQDLRDEINVTLR